MKRLSVSHLIGKIRSKYYETSLSSLNQSRNSPVLIHSYWTCHSNMKRDDQEDAEREEFWNKFAVLNFFLLQEGCSTRRVLHSANSSGSGCTTDFSQLMPNRTCCKTLYWQLWRQHNTTLCACRRREFDCMCCCHSDCTNHPICLCFPCILDVDNRFAIFAYIYSGQWSAGIHPHPVKIFASFPTLSYRPSCYQSQILCYSNRSARVKVQKLQVFKSKSKIKASSESASYWLWVENNWQSSLQMQTGWFASYC